MKYKAIILLTYIVFLFALLSIGFIGQVKAEEVILDTSFEEYPVGVLPNGFSIKYDGKGEEYQVVVDFQAFTGTKSFQLWGVPGWCSNVHYNFDVFSKRYVIVEGKMFSSRDSNNGHDVWLDIVNGNVGWGWGICQIGICKEHINLKLTENNWSSFTANDFYFNPNDWNSFRIIFDNQNANCVVFLNGHKLYESHLDIDTGRYNITLYFKDGHTENYSYNYPNPSAYMGLHGIRLGDCSSQPGGEPSYFDDLKIITSDSNPLECNDRYDEGFEDGKHWCREHPQECGIEIPTDCVATFDMFTNTLRVPNFENQYWLEFGLINWDPVQLQLKRYGPLNE